MRCYFFLLPLLFLFSCIGDDVVQDYVTPVLRVTNPVDTIEAGTTYQFAVDYLNNVGTPEEVTPLWSSSDAAILTITDRGLASAVAAGQTTVTATFTDEFDETVSVAVVVNVGAETVIVEEAMRRTGSVSTTSSYVLSGDFELATIPDSDDLKLSFGDDYRADNSLPGLFVYLSNNRNSISGALEIAAVRTFSGAHEYEISGAQLEEYAYVLYFCKPFNVKVGDGALD